MALLQPSNFLIEVAQSMFLQKREPSTPFVGLDRTITDFWQWAYSDVLSNRNRSILAEWLVGTALGVTSSPRVEWDGYDFNYGKLKVEVKSSAFLQSLPQVALWKPAFDIAPKRGWVSERFAFSSVPVRLAHVYVFALFAEQERAKADLLNVDQWQFYILTTQAIADRFGELKTLSLKRLRENCEPCNFAEIRGRVEQCRG